MKKIILIAACPFFAGAACAQSSTQIFGVLDMSLSHASGSIANMTKLSKDGLSASLLGFRGTEDLGGGLKAGYWLESTLSPAGGNGAGTNSNNQTSGFGGATSPITFNRRSTLSIGGAWGELRLGREYVPSYWNLSYFDPFLNIGAGATAVLQSTVIGVNNTGVRASNSVSYIYGNAFNELTTGAAFSQGFNFVGMYFSGENASNLTTKNDGNGYGAKVGWANGPFLVAAASTTTKYLAGDVRDSNVAAEYRFGSLRLSGNVASDRAGSVSGHGGLIGITKVLSQHMFRAAVSTYRKSGPGDPEDHKLSLGYAYNFSKRTAVYATAARVWNHGGAAFAINAALTGPNTTSTGFEVGMRHIF
ncbi:MAG: porin [Pseudomonadota bacterium]